MFVQPKQLRGRKPIIQIRAGRMEKEGKLVKPETKKGVFTLVNDTSGALEILWTNMNDPTDTQTTMVFPGEATFDRVTKCTTGRVFVLDFKGNRQMFWWLQESNEDRDEELLKVMKKHLEQKGSGSSGNAGSSGGAGSGQQGLDMNSLQSILANLGGGAGASAAPRPPAGSSTGAAPRPAAPPIDEVDIQDVVTSPEVLAAINEDPAYYMTQLHQYLPDGVDPSDDIVEQLRNPQVSGTAGLLQAAVSQADGFREIVNAFNLGEPNGIGATAFLRHVEEAAKKKKEDEEKKKKEAEEKK